MSDNMCWRYGETNPVILPVDGETLIEIGDLVYLNTSSGNAEPAASQANQGSAAANQKLFHTNFAGVAMQRSQSGDTDPIRVATSGVFEFACPAGAIELGTLLGPYQAGDATVLSSQEVATVSDVDEAIGRCAKIAASTDTSVLLDIVSTVLFGGPQAPAS